MREFTIDVDITLVIICVYFIMQILYILFTKIIPFLTHKTTSKVEELEGKIGRLIDKIDRLVDKYESVQDDNVQIRSKLIEHDYRLEKLEDT